MKKLLSIILVACLCFTLVPSAFAASQTLTTLQNNLKTVDILVYSDEDHLIYASIPEEYASMYKEQLDSDSAFARSEAAEALSALNPSTRVLPEGIIEYQSYMYRSDIEAAIDAAAGQGTFVSTLSLFGGVATSGFIQQIFHLANVTSATALAVTLLGAALSAAQQEREEWWVQAYIDIVNGVITAVRYTIIQNTQSEYPKAWRVFERI